MAYYGINAQKADAQNAMNAAQNAQADAHNKEINSPEYKLAQYEATYGKKEARASDRADAQLSADLRMKEAGGSQKDVAMAVQKPQIEADKYKVDATTGAEVKIAGIGADTSKYAADMGYKGAELSASTAKYGMDKTFDLGNRQLQETGRQFNVGMTDKQTERSWQSGENRADRALQSSLLGFQTSLQMISGGGRASQANNYWK